LHSIALHIFHTQKATMAELWRVERWVEAAERVRSGAGSELDWLVLAAVAMLTSGIVALVFLQVRASPLPPLPFPNTLPHPFRSLQCVAAPYGRYQTTSVAAAFGPPLPGRLAWFLQELPSLAWVVYVYYSTSGSGGGQLSPQRILMLLYALHYTNRTLVFPLRILDGKPTPFFVFLMAFGFCLWNGWLQARGLANTSFPTNYVESPQFLAGLLLFFLGMGINVEADATLRNLRADPARKSGYFIPYVRLVFVVSSTSSPPVSASLHLVQRRAQGGMFEYVSGANFFGEIVEWTGFAIASNFSLFAVAFAVFTACNIGPRAVQHHRWYLEKFRESYPRDRKALFPFLL
jgi:3-oxo-5-alpha-steroid 4-dehydrogenase 1